MHQHAYNSLPTKYPLADPPIHILFEKTKNLEIQLTGALDCYMHQHAYSHVDSSYLPTKYPLADPINHMTDQIMELFALFYKFCHYSTTF